MGDSPSQAFKRYRKTAGLTQVELAAKFGVQQPTIHRYETTREPPVKLLNRVKQLALKAIMARRKGP